MLGETRGLASVSTLASATLPSRSVDGLLEHRRRAGGRGRTRRPRSRRRRAARASARRRRARRWRRWRRRSHSEDRRAQTSAMAEIIVEADGVTLAGEESGEGTPVVLLHGLTATRRYVVMGSRALQRAGHRVVAYDARGHGAVSTGAGAGGLRLRDARAATCSRCSTTAGSTARVLAGASMGAHTLVRFALDHGDRVAGLVVVTPAFDPDDDAGRSAARPLGRARRRGCARAGWRASSRPTASPTSPERWHETILKVLRQRLSAHEHPEALADALRAVPRSRPFEAWAELRASSRSRRSSSPAATRPTPSTRTRSASATPRRSPARSCVSEEPGQLAAGLAGRPALGGDRRARRRARRGSCATVSSDGMRAISDDRALDHGLAVVGGGEAPRCRRSLAARRRSRRRSPGRATTSVQRPLQRVVAGRAGRRGAPSLGPGGARRRARRRSRSRARRSRVALESGRREQVVVGRAASSSPVSPELRRLGGQQRRRRARPARAEPRRRPAPVRHALVGDALSGTPPELVSRRPRPGSGSGGGSGRGLAEQVALAERRPGGAGGGELLLGVDPLGEHGRRGCSASAPTAVTIRATSPARGRAAAAGRA